VNLSRRAPLLVAAALALAACAGANAPTPIASLPSELPSVDIAALCDASSEMNTDLSAVAAAATAAAAGSGFDLDDADAAIDRLLSELRALPVTGDAATARDTAVTALEKLKSELPEPGQETAQATAAAIVGLDQARSAVCG
jgi:hypothetical protein